MDSGLGPTLRRARKRRKVDLSEVEATLRIRVRYLRAIEEEDWDALPHAGPYARGFIRTYASYLGLDGERLAAEYAPPSGGEGSGGPPAVESVQTGERPARRRRLPSGVATALVVAGLAAVVVAVGLATGGSSGPGKTTPATGGGEAPGGGVPVGATSGPQPGETHPAMVSLSLRTTAEVWVCVVDAHGRAVVEGQVLPGGVEEGPFHSDSFTVAFGNGEVAMQVDGKETDIPASASPLGYAIDSAGRLTRLGEAERPTCL